VFAYLGVDLRLGKKVRGMVCTGGKGRFTCEKKFSGRKTHKKGKKGVSEERSPAFMKGPCLEGEREKRIRGVSLGRKGGGENDRTSGKTF